jgi:hypothetical protein
LISGIVRSADGKPVTGASVFFASGPGSFPDIAALTDGQGRFALSAPSPGTYEIECAASGFAPTRTAATALKDRQVNVEIFLKRT